MATGQSAHIDLMLTSIEGGYWTLGRGLVIGAFVFMALVLAFGVWAYARPRKRARRTSLFDRAAGISSDLVHMAVHFFIGSLYTKGD